MAVLKKYTIKGHLRNFENEIDGMFPNWKKCFWFNCNQNIHRNCSKIAVYSKEHKNGKERFCTLYVPNWTKDCGKRRKFILIDMENNLSIVNITMDDIVNHFIGDGTSCVKWHKGNVDFERYAEEMEEIGYKFVVTY